MANPTRLGSDGVENLAYFKEIWSGEVLTSFKQKTLMEALTNTRSISNGKSASFPVVGNIGAEYHTPGAKLDGLQVTQSETVINIDGKLVSHVFLADIDEAMNYYDVRNLYSSEMGYKLASTFDTNIMKEVIKAARATNGSEIINADFGSTSTETKAIALAQGLFSAAQAMDEKNVEGEKYAVFAPAEYYALAQNTDVINTNFGGQGAISDGSVVKVAGITIVKSNNVPSTDTSVSDTLHGVDASTTKGIVFTKDAVGTVKLMDLATKTQEDITVGGTYIISGYAVGHGVLREECAVELKTA